MLNSATPHHPVVFTFVYSLPGSFLPASWKYPPPRNTGRRYHTDTNIKFLGDTVLHSVTLHAVDMSESVPKIVRFTSSKDQNVP